MAMSEIKRLLKKFPSIYDFLLFLTKREERVRFVLRHIVRWPQIHANYMRCRSNLGNYSTYPRTKHINLKNPIYFDDKLLWLKYYDYNYNPLVQQCYDKFLVRKYIEECGCGYILNELYGVWNDPSEINWSELPEEFVIKKTNDSGNIIFKRKGDDIAEIKKQVNDMPFQERRRIKLYKANGDLFAIRNSQKYICEKMLLPQKGQDLPADYKFYCFHGNPTYILYQLGRVIGKGQHHDIFVDINLKNRSDLYCPAEDFSFSKPKCFEEMIEICRILSAPFPFVRVDLYVQDDHPVFGELTFTPAGGNGVKHAFTKDRKLNVNALLEMGNLIKLPNN